SITSNISIGKTSSAVALFILMSPRIEVDRSSLMGPVGCVQRSIRLRQSERLLGDVAQRELLRHGGEQGQHAFAQPALDVILLREAEPTVRAATPQRRLIAAP